MKALVFYLRFALAVVILVVLCTVGMLAVVLGMKKHQALRLVLPTWAKLNLMTCGLKVEVIGAEHLSAVRPCIYVANHQCLLDAFVFPTILDAPMFYPVKKEFVKVPFMGWLAWMTDQPRIDREDHLRAMQAMDQSVKLLESGLCTLVFPEGTRSRDGKVGAFKKGAFRLSMDTGIPVVPITLIDCADRMPMGSFDYTPGTIHIVVDPPIETKGWNRRNVNQKVDEVRELILRNIEHWRKKLDLPPVETRNPAAGNEPSLVTETPDGESADRLEEPGREGEV